jgi:hypothetical protein
VATVGVADDQEALTGVMRQGMVLRDVVIPIDPQREGAQVLRASEAKVGAPGRLRITNLQLQGHSGSSQAIELRAPSAIYDVRARSIVVRDGFHGAGCGVIFDGTGLTATLAAKVFEFDGRFRIERRQTPMGVAAASRQRAQLRLPSWQSPEMPSRIPELPRQPALARLVTNFAPDIATATLCWGLIAAASDATLGPPGFNLICLDGGRADIGKHEVDCHGRSAFFGHGSMLRSSEGMRLRRESVAGSLVTRVSGHGGVEAWVQRASQDGTWIRSREFAYVSDRQVLQFEGGPLVVGDDGGQLKAAEDWQFVRVFPGSQIVLSPGVWNMVEDADASRFLPQQHAADTPAR